MSLTWVEFHSCCPLCCVQFERSPEVQMCRLSLAESRSSISNCDEDLASTHCTAVSKQLGSGVQMVASVVVVALSSKLSAREKFT
jgi:hypothetical protein